MVKDIHHKKKQLIMPAVKIINIKLLIGMICILSYPVLMFSQKKPTTLSFLQGKNWKMRLNNSKISFVRSFTVDGQAISKTDGIEVKDKYYLSDSIETYFNKNKMRKMDTGKYIIYCTSSYDVVVFEILELNDTYLKLKNLVNPGILEYDVP